MDDSEHGHMPSDPPLDMLRGVRRLYPPPPKKWRLAYNPPDNPLIRPLWQLGAIVLLGIIVWLTGWHF